MRTLTFVVLMIATSIALGKDYVYPATSSIGTHIQKSLIAPTKIIHPKYTVTIPKGWSFDPVGATDQFASTLTVAPFPSVDTSETIFTIAVAKEPSDKTLAQLKDYYISKGLNPVYKKWKKRDWIYAELFDTTPSGVKIKAYQAYAKVDGILVAATAFTPVKQRAKYEPLLKKMIEGIDLIEAKKK